MGMQAQAGRKAKKAQHCLLRCRCLRVPASRSLFFQCPGEITTLISLSLNDAFPYFLSAFMIFLSSAVLNTTVIFLPEGLT